jgi:4-hydroxy-tetrahydrodipicolinate synthase
MKPPTTALSGVFPPVITPLHDDRSLDVASYERILNRLIDAGVDGLFILGSTSEVAFCTNDMRESIVAEAVRIVAGRVPVLAGVIDMQTARVIEHIKAAQAAGVDGVVATAPFYAITHAPQIKKHFELLGAAAEVPVYAYDIPVCVHTKLDPDLLVELGSSGAIAGVKDSSNDDVSFRRLVLKNRLAGEPLVLFTGHEFVVDGAYLAGAHGCVPGLGNVDPAGYVRLHRACQDGDWAAARAEQDRLASLMEICLAPRGMTGWGAGVGAFKTALVLQGVISSNQVPEPFDALTGADVEAIKRILDRCGPRP